MTTTKNEYAKISDVISRLQSLKKEHGDVVVCCAEMFGGGFAEIKLPQLEEVIWFSPQSPSCFAGRTKDFPDSVSISL